MSLVSTFGVTCKENTKLVEEWTRKANDLQEYIACMGQKKATLLPKYELYCDSFDTPSSGKTTEF